MFNQINRLCFPIFSETPVTHIIRQVTIPVRISLGTDNLDIIPSIVYNL